MVERSEPRHAATIGILMLDTAFERFVGDIGNPRTWPFPVRYHIVRGASPDRVTRPDGPDMLDAFKVAADELIAHGVAGIVTSCGFLALYQAELSAHCSVPVATSALLQVPMAARILPRGKRPAILTFSAEGLTRLHLESVGVDPATPVAGMPASSDFQRSIRTGDRSVSSATLEGEVLAAAAQMVRGDPSIGALVLECTNMTPYSHRISRALGVPVFDMVTLVHWLHRSVSPQSFSQE